MKLMDYVPRSILGVALAGVMCVFSGPLSAQDRNVAAVPAAGDSRPTDALGDPLPAGALLRLGTRRFQHPSGPSQIILARNESIVLSIDRNDLIAWDSTSGKQLWREHMRFHGGMWVSAAGYGISPLAITPDDGRLVTPAGLGSIAYWDVTQGESTLVMVETKAPTKSIDVSPGGKFLALGTSHSLLVCDRTGKEIFRKENPDQPLAQRFNDRDRLKFGGDFSYGKFSPDGKLLALVNSSQPNTIQLLEAATGNRMRDIEGTDRIVRMAFSPNSKQIVATERDISARLYDVRSGQRLWEYVIQPPNAAESYTSAVAFRPDARQIAVGAPVGSDYRIRLLDAETGKETGSLMGSQWKPWTLKYQADSQVLFSSGWDGVIRKWDLQTDRQLPLPNGLRASSVCVMSRAGRYLAFADDTENLHIVDVKSGETLKKFAEAQIGWSQAVFSHDGKRLAAGGAGDLEVHVVVWDIETQAKLHHWSWKKGRDTHSKVEALAFSKSGDRIAAAVFRQDAAYVWDLPSNQQIAKVKHVDVYGLDIDASGRTIFTAGWDKTIRVWDCNTGIEIKALYEALYDQLVRSDGVESFVAYQRLSQSPERALEVIPAKLSEANREVSATDIRRWIVALGADNQMIVKRATEQLVAWGPPVWDQLSDASDSRSLTENKRKRIEGITRAILRGYRRATTLIAEIDAPAADEALGELLMRTRSRELQAIVKAAQKRREERAQH